MTAGPATLVPWRPVPWRLGRGASALDAEQVEVQDQQALLAVPVGMLPVLRGSGAFALGSGAPARARDDVRVCVVEGGGVLAGERAHVQVWEGGAVAGEGAIDVTVGRGGRAWVVSDAATVRCRPGPQGLEVDETAADLEAVVHGTSDVYVEGGTVTAGGGARVRATGRATLVVDRSTTGRSPDSRFVQRRAVGMLAPPDPTSC